MTTTISVLRPLYWSATCVSRHLQLRTGVKLNCTQSCQAGGWQMNPSTLVTSRRDDCLRPCAADLRPCADRSVVRTALVSSWPRRAAPSWPRHAAPSWPRHAAPSWPRRAARSWPRHAAPSWPRRAARSWPRRAARSWPCLLYTSPSPRD